ncbi:MAG: 30S ribosome-binding factor RbfA [bacterium]|nr:30S ribosome-binding factor RbfA [bacterium]
MSRLDKISSLIKQTVADILLKKIQDQRIGFVTITHVKVTRDLKKAWIYYSLIGSSTDKNRTKRRLDAISKVVKGELGRAVNLRTVPDIYFKFDNTIENGVNLVNKINALPEQ